VALTHASGEVPISLNDRRQGTRFPPSREWQKTCGQRSAGGSFDLARHPGESRDPV